jgi:hypothetical protein
MICQNVNELIDTLNHCCYIRNTDFEGGQVLVCNLCGETVLSMSEMLEHLRGLHINDTIPDVDPTNEGEF